MKYKVYELKDNEFCYYGFTTMELSKRFNLHRNNKNCRKNHNSTSSKLDLDVATIEQLYEYDTKLEARTMETHLIRNQVCVNKNVSILTPEENKQYHHDWYIANSGEILKTMAEIVTCPKCDIKMRRGSYVRHAKTACGKPPRKPAESHWECPDCSKVLRNDSKYHHRRICVNAASTSTSDSVECPTQQD